MATRILPIKPTGASNTNTSRLLYAWMDPVHLEQQVGPHVYPSIQAQHAAAWQARLALPQAAPPRPILQSLTDAAELAWAQEVASQPAFQKAFGHPPGAFSFARVPIEALVTFQPWLHPYHTPVPTEGLDIFKWCLPKEFTVTSEMNVEAGTDGIPRRMVMATDDPSAILQVAMTPVGLALGAGPRLNWVQVVDVQGMYVLKNGYHRVAALHAAGHTEVPAVVTSAARLEEVVLPAPGFFNAGYLAGLPRKPMVADFQNPSFVVDVPHGKQKRVIEVRFDVASFNVPV
ncbi:MAG TPA: hypothetical protein VM681_11245 [Candidatus Thermoplasmatota archaeon]|nr:hypothetical protein [Candidatus Thermoplasmatota archaeon]